MSRFSELAKQQRLHETQEQYAKRFGFETASACSLWESGQRKVPEIVIESIVFESLPKYQVCEHCHGRGLVTLEKEMEAEHAS